MVLPDKFKCVITNWDYIYNLTRTVANDIKASGYRPDIIIALARGGWFPGRVLCDFLGLNDLTSLKIEHYLGTAAASGQPEIKYPLTENSVKGKNVLIVDDIVDTGKSMIHSKEYVRASEAQDIRTAALQYLYTSEMIPDYLGEKVEEWAWIVYPWNFIEDMMDIISKLMVKEKKDVLTLEDIRNGLYHYHMVDPITFEIAQPGRLIEVMTEMERVGMVEPKKINGRTGWSFLPE